MPHYDQVSALIHSKAGRYSGQFLLGLFIAITLSLADRLDLYDAGRLSNILIAAILLSIVGLRPPVSAFLAVLVNTGQFSATIVMMMKSVKREWWFSLGDIAYDISFTMMEFLIVLCVASLVAALQTWFFHRKWSEIKNIFNHSYALCSIGCALTLCTYWIGLFLWPGCSGILLAYARFLIGLPTSV